MLDLVKMVDSAGKDPGKDTGFMEKIKRVLPLAESTLANTFLVGIFKLNTRKFCVP